LERELRKLNFPKINEPIKKWATELNKTFSKKEVQMAKKNEKMLTIPGHKATLRFHLTLVRIASIKNTNNKCW
jgi:hypothetical protein